MQKDISVYYRIPLRTLVASEKNKNVKFIRQNYGQLGLDIFENKKVPSILNKKDKSKFSRLINSIKQFFGFIGKEDYKESDSLNVAMFKYLYNNKQVKDTDIEKVFGKSGMELFEVFKSAGYVYC